MKIALNPLAAALFAGVLTCTAYAQSTWHLRFPTPTSHGRGLFGSTYANGLHVAVGYGGTILTSPDAVTWTVRSEPSNTVLTDVAFGNGRFLAPSVSWADWKSSEIRISSDGLAWTTHALPSGFRPERMTHAFGLFVASGQNPDPDPVGNAYHAVATSPDGMTWTIRWTGHGIVSNEYGHAPLWNFGSTLWFSTRERLLRSDDAVNWTVVPESGPTEFLAADTTGRLVAVRHERKENGDLTPSVLTFSSDGTQWTEVLSLPGRGIRALAYGNGEFILLSWSFDNSFSVHRSPDGHVWTESPSVGLPGMGFGPYRLSTASNLQHTPDGWLLVGQPKTNLASRDGRIHIYTSPDGVTWTSRAEQAFYWLPYFSVESGELVAREPAEIISGDQDTLTLLSRTIRSPDGVTWSKSTFEAGHKVSKADVLDWSSIFDVQRRVKLPTEATDGRNRVRLLFQQSGVVTGVTLYTWTLEHSVDGVAWRESFRTEPKPFDYWPQLDAVVNGNGRFLALSGNIGTNTPLFVLVSDDGMNWTRQIDLRESWVAQGRPYSPRVDDLLFANGELHVLGLGHGGQFLLSTETGDDWTVHDIEPLTEWHTPQRALFATPQSLFLLGSSIRQSPWDLRLRALRRNEDGTVELRISGIVGQQVELQAANSLAAPDWQPVSTTTLNVSPMNLAIPVDSQSQQRFYRLRYTP